MRIILLILLGFIYVNGKAQNKIKGYLYWFDNDFNHSVRTNITPVQNYTLTAQIGTSSLLKGLHLFNIGFFDDSAGVSITNSSFFYKTDPESGITDVAAYQYWFDDDFTNTYTQPVTSSNIFTLNNDLVTSNLLNGLHVLQVRFRDNKNKWSETLSHFFYKSDFSGSTHNIIAFQYWFDQNFSSSIQQNLANGTGYALSMPVDASQLLNGLHVLNVRFLDNVHKWSIPLAQFFYKAPESTNSNIVAFQYWFDQNFAGAVKQNISPSAIYNISEHLSDTILLNGLHTLSMRFSDNHGKWSSTETQFFYKDKPATVTENNISAYRYWFDEGDTTLNLVNIVPFMNQFTTNQQIAAYGMDSGQHVIHFQFRDMQGKWSMVSSDTTTVTSKAIYTFTGNGNWSNAENWVNKIKPPLILSGSYKIFIDPVAGGNCILDVDQHISSGGIITVRAGKSFVIPEKLQINVE